MTTLIAVYHGSRCVGRCDARCYNAHGPNCNCVCRGRHHGVGFDDALEQVVDHEVGIDLSEWADERGLPADRLGVQLRLTRRGAI